LPRQQDEQAHPQPARQAAEKGTTPVPHPTYRIRLKGHLHTRWSTWFNHLTITLEENGDTLLTGPIVDQAALHGILTRIRDLGLTLVSVIEIDPSKPDEADGNVDTRSHKETSS
jgi:hypothetical protein